MFPHNRFNILMKLIVYLREETMSRVCAVCQVALVTSDSVTPWTVACQAPLSMGFSRQEYWSGLPCLPPGDLPDPGIELVSLMSPVLADRFFTTSTTREAQIEFIQFNNVQIKEKVKTSFLLFKFGC